MVSINDNLMPMLDGLVSVFVFMRFGSFPTFMFMLMVLIMHM